MAAGRIKGITIEIGGDPTKLTSALAKVDSAISKTQSNLRDLNKALKLDPGNTDLLKDKQKELATAIEETKSKLETEKQALEQMKSTEGFDENSRAARDLQIQIDLDTAALKELERQARESSSVLGSQMQAAGQKIQEVGDKIKGIGDKLSSLGSTLTTRVTVPIATAFGGILKTTADFDSQMSKVKAISGATGSEFDQLTAKAREMGEATKYSATESGQAFEYMAMAGWKTEDMLSGIEGIMNLAAASGEDLATTSDIVTDALTAFGMEASDSSRFADVLAAAASNANTNVAMMGESFKYAAPVAGALNYSIEDVAIALGLMANAGIKADMAGTSLRNVFQRMAKPTKDSHNAMVKLGLSLADTEGNAYSFREVMDQIRESFGGVTVDLSEYNAALDDLDEMLEKGEIDQEEYNDLLKEINVSLLGSEGAEKARLAAMLGGARAMSGLLAIANATEEDYNQLTEAIDRSSDSFAKLADGSIMPLNQALASGQEVVEQYNGAAEAMAAIMQDNLTGDLTILKSKIQELAISMGNLLMPKAREIVDKIKAIVDKLNALDDSEKMQIMKIAAVVAAVGPALLITGKIISAIGSVVSVFGGLVTGIGKAITFITGFSGGMSSLSAVFAAITGPIGIVVAAIAALTAGFIYLYNTNEEFRNSVKQTISTLQDNFSKAMEAIKPALDSLGQAFGKLLEVLAPVFEALFTQVMAIINGIIAAMAPIIDVITNVVEFVTNIIQAFLALLEGDFDGFWTYLGAAFQNFVNIFIGIANAWIAAVTAYFQTFGVNLKAIFTATWNGIKTAVSTIINTIKSTIETLWNSIKDWLFTTLENIKEKFTEIFEAIREGVHEKIDLVKEKIINGLEEACDYIKSLPQKFFEWGADMVQKLIDGIQSKIAAVKAKASELASAISGYIHFSEPDVGPLSNFHTFMPDMISEMVKGINQGIPQVASAMNNLTSNMVPQMTGAQNIATSNNVTINIYGAQGRTADDLVDEIEQRLAANAIRRGVAFG